jgi:hypothetical protein
MNEIEISEGSKKGNEEAKKRLRKDEGRHLMKKRREEARLRKTNNLTSDGKLEIWAKIPRRIERNTNQESKLMSPTKETQ